VEEGGASTVFTAVAITVMVIGLCCLAVTCCCCKELYSCLFGGGKESSGDYDMNGMGEAGPLVEGPYMY